MQKRQRQQLIVDLVRLHEIHSQQDLLDLLEADAVEVTQATLSRDLRELSMFKGPEGYVLPDEAPDQDNESVEAALALSLQREMLTIDHAAHTVVVHTRPGHGNALAIQFDRAHLPDVLGTIAGDDTILIITRSGRAATTLLKRVRALISG